MADQPFLPFFVGDFLGATVTWEGEERALYMLMLAYQWSGGALPANLEKLSRTLGYPHEKFVTLWETVGTKFVSRKGSLYNERLEYHRARTVEISNARSSAGSIGGKASAAKRAAQAQARKEPQEQANGQATVEANVESSLGKTQAIVESKYKQNSTILSDPILSDPIHISHSLNAREGAGIKPEGREGKDDIPGGQAWRDVTECDPRAYEAWLDYRRAENDPVPARVRLEHAKWLGGRGTPDQQRELVATCIRLQFKRLRDPTQGGRYPDGNGTHPPPVPMPVKSAAQLEAEAIARGEDIWAVKT